MEESEETTQKTEDCAPNPVESQNEKATGEVSSQTSNPGSVSKPSDETEPRWSRLKLFDKVMQKSLEKFIDHAR